MQEGSRWLIKAAFRRGEGGATRRGEGVATYNSTTILIPIFYH